MLVPMKLARATFSGLVRGAVVVDTITPGKGGEPGIPPKDTGGIAGSGKHW
jgi:hypothetical protein